MSLTTSNPNISSDYEAELSGYYPEDDSADAMIAEERSTSQPYFFIPAIVSAAVSYFAGGIPQLNDFSWAMITILCAVFLIGEFRAFSFRWGIGGLTLYGGCLVWLCHDYLFNWFGIYLYSKDDSNKGYATSAVALSTLAHTIFIPMMIFGLRLKLGGRVERFLSRIPGPKSSRVWVVLFVTLVLFGYIPHAFFTQEGLFGSLWNDFWAGRGGAGAKWVVGRTGNANYSYGAYLAQVIQVGQFGALLAMYWAVMIARTNLGRFGAFLLWLPHLGIAFGGGSRGPLVATCLPIIGFLFLRFQAEAAARGKRVSLQAYGWLAATLLVVLLIVQTQITFRNVGFRDADLSKISISAGNIQGNSMFSEGLRGFEIIPEYRAPFHGQYPFQAAAMVIPDTVFWFFVTPMPRAVWTSKPIDPVGPWYNRLLTGGKGDGVEGTTISHGLVGVWFFKFGWWGVIQGGLIIGFVLGVAERLLRNFGHTPLALIVSLAVVTWQFRAFRGWNYLDFHGVLVGVTGLALFYVVIRLLIGDSEQEAA